MNKINFRGAKGLSDKQRFEMSYIIDEKTNCWVWIAGIKRGMPHINIKKYFTSAKRYSFELHIGEILIDNLTCISICNNDLCVNPEHLKLIDKSKNATKLAQDNAYKKSSGQCITCGFPKEFFVYHKGKSCGVCPECARNRARKRKDKILQCKHGHKFIDGSYRVKSNGTRECLICKEGMYKNASN